MRRIPCGTENEEGASAAEEIREEESNEGRWEGGQERGTLEGRRRRWRQGTHVDFRVSPHSFSRLDGSLRLWPAVVEALGG